MATAIRGASHRNGLYLPSALLCAILLFAKTIPPSVCDQSTTVALSSTTTTMTTTTTTTNPTSVATSTTTPAAPTSSHKPADPTTADSIEPPTNGPTTPPQQAAAAEKPPVVKTEVNTVTASVDLTTATPTGTTTDTTTGKPPVSQAEAKKLIQQHIQILSPNRIIFNKPHTPGHNQRMMAFPAGSPEAGVAQAAAQFGFDLLKNLPANEQQQNIVISPLSLQTVLNMVLLGSDEGSVTQQELEQALAYGAYNLTKQSDPKAERLTPHKAQRNIFQSILAATELPQSVLPDDKLLLNTDQDTLTNLKGLLHTSHKDGGVPISNQINFTIANLAIVNEDLGQLKQGYEDELKTFYDVDLSKFSAKKGEKQSPNDTNGMQLPIHERINKWVQNKTHDQIKELARKEDFDDNLLLVLLNAAQFKGRWLRTFNEKLTREDTFYNHGSEKGAKLTPFMRIKDVFGYAEFGSGSLMADIQRLKSSLDSDSLLNEDPMLDSKGLPPTTVESSKEELERLEKTSKLNCTALMLPFSLNGGHELTMLLLLPTERNGLGQLEAALDGAALSEIYKSLIEQEVQVEVPKFSFESKLSTLEALSKMGLKEVFSEAHLDRMFQNLKVKARIDKIVHKSKISIDETGAEAAASSMVAIVSRSSLRPRAHTFNANHPFLFFITHNPSGMPLFMGRVNSF